MSETSEAERQLKELQARHIKERDLADVKDVLRTRSGRRLFWRILEEGHVFQTSMTGNSYTYFLEGARNLGLKFYGDLMAACPERMQEMWKEAMIQKQEDEAYGRPGN